MLVNEIVAQLRTSIKEYSDDSYYEDEFLLGLFLNQRATLLRQKLLKNNHVSPQNYTTFCMSLIPGVSHECGCITVGCKVYRSRYKLPNYISGRNSSQLEFYTLSYDKIDLVQESDLTAIKYSKIIGSRPHVIMANRNIVLFEKEYDAIMVRALLENPLEIKDVQHCAETPTSISCIDVYSEDIFADRDLCDNAISLVLTKDLRIPMSTTTDMNNDANPEIRG